MTSPKPLIFDTYYHIFNRGNNGENIFIEERNYAHFLNLYEVHLAEVADLFAYCLMRNHFHILVRIKSEEEIAANIRMNGSLAEKLPPNFASQRFSNFFNAYAKAINTAYCRTGSLFQNPFKRVPITSDQQYWNVIAYIHQNPQKHRFVNDFRDWKYSSYGMILSTSHSSLKRNQVLEWFGGKQDYLRLHDQWLADAQCRWFADEDA